MSKTFIFPERPYIDTTVPVHQQEMLNACETGNLGKLMELFDAAGVSGPLLPTERGFDQIPRSGPPATSDLLYRSIQHHHSEILRFLLRTYPSTSVRSDIYLSPNYANPDLSTLRILHSHDPSIVNYELGHSTLLILYCREGDPHLADFLLENGADPTMKGFPLAFPLPIAIYSGQPSWLIEKLIQSGAEPDVTELTYAVEKQRMDILDLLLSHHQWRSSWHGARRNMKIVLQKAHETANKELIKLVERRIKLAKKEMRCFQGWR